MTYGTFEAKLAELLIDFENALPSNIKLAYLPSSGVIKLRLTATGNDQKKLDELMSVKVRELYRVIPEYIYGENEDPIEKVIGDNLKVKVQTVCTAESCTGGEIAHLLTSIAGSSAYYKGSIIAYSNSVKSKLLQIPEELLSDKGAVSEEVVTMMAEKARILLGADYCIATSGIAGPDGGSESKPVGTLWMAVSSANGTVSEKRVFGTERSTNIRRFSLAALNLLRKQIVNF
jgi:nicotinamide-nucleotide amidase